MPSYDIDLDRSFTIEHIQPAYQSAQGTYDLYVNDSGVWVGLDSYTTAYGTLRAGLTFDLYREIPSDEEIVDVELNYYVNTIGSPVYRTPYISFKVIDPITSPKTSDYSKLGDYKTSGTAIVSTGWKTRNLSSFISKFNQYRNDYITIALEGQYIMAHDFERTYVTINTTYTPSRKPYLTITTAKKPNNPTNLSFLPDPPKQNNNLQGSANYYDGGGNHDYITFKWYVNNSLRRTQKVYNGGTSGTCSDVLLSSYYSSGDIIHFTAQSFNNLGLSSGISTSSSKVVITDKYNLNINIQGEGNVTKSPNKVGYDPSGPVTLTASPNPNWYFKHWLEGQQTIGANPWGITMTSNRNITAVFIKKPKLNTNIVGSGTITRTPNKEYYEKDQQVSLTATATSGWKFIRWGGDLTSVNMNETITMTSEKNITAYFEKYDYKANCVFEGNQIAVSKSIDYNNNLVRDIIFNAEYTGDLDFYVTANGTDWEKIESETHIFETQGKDLRWKAIETSGNPAMIKNLTIKINQ